MCTVNEYYNLDLESCLPCSTCEDGDTVMVKCSYFEDTVCQKDFWQGFVLLSEPLPTSPYIPRGPGPRTVEVLPEDWTSGPAVSMAMSAFGLSLFVAVIIILGCICKKSWSQKKDKIIYLTRGKISFYSDNSKSCNYNFLHLRLMSSRIFWWDNYGNKSRNMLGGFFFISGFVCSIN